MSEILYTSPMYIFKWNCPQAREKDQAWSLNALEMDMAFMESKVMSVSPRSQNSDSPYDTTIF